MIGERLIFLGMKRKAGEPICGGRLRFRLCGGHPLGMKAGKRNHAPPKPGKKMFHVKTTQMEGSTQNVQK